jgi:hypothetical protein
MGLETFAERQLFAVSSAANNDIVPSRNIFCSARARRHDRLLAACALVIERCDKIQGDLNDMRGLDLGCCRHEKGLPVTRQPLPF